MLELIENIAFGQSTTSSHSLLYCNAPNTKRTAFLHTIIACKTVKMAIVNESLMHKVMWTSCGQEFHSIKIFVLVPCCARILQDVVTQHSPALIASQLLCYIHRFANSR